MDNNNVMTPEDKVIKDLFSGALGEDALNILCSRYMVFDGTFSENPHKMYFREGQKSVLMDILIILNVNPKHFGKMLDTAYEHNNDPREKE